MLKNYTVSLHTEDIYKIQAKTNNLSAYLRGLIERDLKAHEEPGQPEESIFDKTKRESQKAYEKQRQDVIDTKMEELSLARRAALDAGDIVLAEQLKEKMKELL